MDSTPRYVWVEKGGGREKNGVLSKERRTPNAQKNNSFQTQSSTTRRNRLLQRRAKSEVMAVVLNASNLVNGAVTVATDLSTTTCILGGRIGHLATRHNHGSVSI